MALPIAGPMTMAEADRMRAYIDKGRRVLGNMEARKSVLPNSNEREFQAEKE